MIKSYDELTINKYLELQAMLEEEWNELELQVHLIAILSDMTDDEVLNLSLDDYQEKVRQTSFLLEKQKYFPLIRLYFHHYSPLLLYQYSFAYY